MFITFRGLLAILSFKDFWKSSDKGAAVRSGTFFKKTGCQPSGAGDFPWFNSWSFLSTISRVITKEFKYSPKNGFSVVIGISSKPFLRKCTTKEGI